MAVGVELEHQVKGLITVVQFQTYKRWVREQQGGRQPGRVGRPRKIGQQLRELIVRLWVSPATYHPNGEWVLQQGRNLLMWLEELGLEATHLIHDRDNKFTDAFGALFENSSGIGVVKSPVRAPNANAYAESRISTIKRECLDYFACFSLKHSDCLVQTFVGFYKGHRPHQTLGNRTLDASDKPSLGFARDQAVVGKIGCRSELGGLLKYYYRSAA